MGFVGVAPGTTTLTLADGTTIALADWIDDQIYSTGQLANGQTTSVDLFSTGRSQQIPGGNRPNTRVDTNVPKQGDNGLPMDWEMLIFSLAIKPVRAMRPATGLQPVLADVIDPATGGGVPGAPFSTLLRTQNFFELERVLYLEYFYNGKSYSQGTMNDYPFGAGFYVTSTASNYDVSQNGFPSPRDRQSMVLPIHMREGLGYRWNLQPEVALALVQQSTDNGAPFTFVDVKGALRGLIKRTVV